MNIDQQEKQKQLKIKQYRDGISELESAIKYMETHVYLLIAKNRLFVVPFNLLFKTQQDNVSNVIWEMKSIDYSTSKFYTLDSDPVTFETIEEFDEYIGDQASKTNTTDLYSKEELKPIANFGLTRDIINLANSQIEKSKMNIKEAQGSDIYVTNIDGKQISTNDFMDNHVVRHKDFTTYGGTHYAIYETKGLKHDLYVEAHNPLSTLHDKKIKGRVITNRPFPIDEHKIHGTSSELTFDENWKLIIDSAKHESENEEWDNSWD